MKSVFHFHLRGGLVPPLLFSTWLFFLGNNYWDRHWYAKWWWCLTLLLIPLVKDLPKILQAALLYSMGYSLYVLGRPTRMNIVDLLVQGKNAAYFLVTVILLTVFIKKIRLKDLNTLGWVSLFHSLQVLCLSFFYESYFRGGTLGNASMSACFLAMTAPLSPVPLLNIAAIFLSGSAMGIGVLAVVLISYRPKLLLGVPLVFAIAYFLQGHELLNDSDRLKMWKLGFDYWKTHVNIWIGSGPGTLSIHLPYLQKMTLTSQEQVWMWFHNDWWDLIFEQGISGGVLYAGVALCVLYHARYRPRLRSGILGFLASTLGNYPSHLPLTAISGLILVGVSLGDQKMDAPKRRFGFPFSRSDEDTDFNFKSPSLQGTGD
jgi:hypothetical protein